MAETPPRLKDALDFFSEIGATRNVRVEMAVSFDPGVLGSDKSWGHMIVSCDNDDLVWVATQARERGYEVTIDDDHRVRLEIPDPQ